MSICKINNRPVKFICLALLSMILTAEVQSQDVNEEQFIQWTSSVGQMLYSYHSAFDIAVRVIHQQTGSDDIPKLYAGGPYDDGWAFSFGEIESNGEFILTYRVIVGPNGEVLSFDHFDFRRVASSHHTLAAHALLEVMGDFEEFRSEADKFEAEVFRYAVLPFPRNQLTAFASPKQICNNATLVGNDIMYTLTRADSKIISRTRFIHSLINFPIDRPDNFVSIALKVPDNPMPSPVDVLTAMERGERVAAFAGMGAFMIEPDGTIQKLSDDDPLIKDLRE